jgi:hypothetical protein
VPRARAAVPEQSGEIAATTRAEVRRRPVDHRRDHLGQRGELGLERGECSRVGRRELRDLPHGLVLIGTDQQPPAVREQVQRRARGVDDDPALDEPHVTPDRLAQHREHVRAGRSAEARRELLGDAGAADDVAALEHQRPHPAAREVERGDEPVVPAADDDRIVRHISGLQTADP